MKPTLDNDGFYESGNSYWTLKGCCEIRLTNFTIEPCHKSIIEGNRYCRCLLRSNSGEPKGIELTTDDVGSINKFRKYIAEYGNFLFHGSKKDFSRFRKWLVREMEKTEDHGEYRYVAHGDEAVATMRNALKEGRVRCIKWEEAFCLFSVYQESGNPKYRFYRMRNCDAIAAMRQIPIVPFRFIIEENKYAEDWTYDPKKGGAA